MCGIAGIISTSIHEGYLRKMSETLAHRGPDGSGIWKNPAGNAGLAHRRLAIIDLSNAASQPMQYLNRYTIVYNGEIYNYPELRNELRKAGYEFRTESDTEVIAAAYDCYKNKCLQFFDGMFAFAIWDEWEQLLFAARDRFGEKPFYYWHDDTQLAFASEMKALWAIGVEKQIDERMMLNYLALGQVQNPVDKFQTFYKDILSLPPAHYLIWKRLDPSPIVRNYWNIDKQIQYEIDPELAMNAVDKILTVSVKRRIRSDVPVGMSLSGGLDSSILAWYLNREKENFSSFSAVFPGFEKDEAAFIHQITDAIPHKNFSLTPTAKELAEDLEQLIRSQEEPFPSSSIYAQYRVCKAASEQGIKVLIDGQGADEIFAGYHRYAHWFLQEMINRNRFSRANRERRLLRKQNVAFSWGIKNIMATYLPSHAAVALEKKEYNRILHHPEISKEYLNHLQGKEWEGISKPLVTKLNDILYFNTMGMGLEELLRFADRNSMAHGVEIRLPFLQHELVEFAFTLPSILKVKDGYPKWILRKMMENRLDDRIIWRKGKTGYETPQEQWMANPSVQECVMEARKKLVEERMLKPSVLQKKIREKPAYAADNYDWRYLCAAGILGK